MIEYIKGDLFTTDVVHIAHGCNCQGVMGAGVAKIVKDRFPNAFKVYHNRVILETNQNLASGCDPTRSLLGKVIQAPMENDKIIIHCLTQDYYGNNWRHVNYDAVATAFEKIALSYPPKTLAMPKIGTGLGGGDWNIIEAIIESTLCKVGMSVKVYEL